MNVLLLGNGDDELAWARWLLGRAEHRLDAAYPGFSEAAMAGIPVPLDLEDALARPGIDAVVVGGPIESRGESLRRAAAEGYAIIALHPPGADSEAYYQVALSREETGAVIVPDLPLRLHPGVIALRQALSTGELGTSRGVQVESHTPGPGAGLVRIEFARLVDAVRAIVGEIDALTATGDPPGEDPDLELVVQLRSADSRRAEVRIRSGTTGSTRISLLGSGGSLTLEFDPRLARPVQLIRHRPAGAPEVRELPAWDAHEAIMAVLASSIRGRGTTQLPGPSLLDGTRAMELAEAVNRSIRRGRTVELYYEAISEEATFKSIMTSTGCLIFLGSLLLLPLSMAGPPLGMSWTLFIPYVIPPLLAAFVLLQTLRLAIRRPGTPDADPGDGAEPGGPPREDQRPGDRESGVREG